MKILFINLPYYGHVVPTIGLVQELIKQGCEVSYLMPFDWEDIVLESGATFIGYPNHRQLSEQMKNAYKVAESIVECFDLVIYEQFFFLGKHLTEKYNKPVVRIFTAPCTNEKLMNEYLCAKGPLSIFKSKWIAKAFTKDIARNIPMKTDNWLDEIVNNPPKLNLVYTLREYQPYEEEFLDNQYKFLGPSIYERKSDAFDFEKGDRPVVYISLGTIVKGARKFFQTCIDAFCNIDMDIIISVGKQFDIRKLKNVSSNIHIYNFVPQLEVLKIADVFVTHGGMNSVSEALVYGVKMVVIPFNSDQPVNAQSVEKMGVGKRLEYQDVSVNTLKDTIKSVLIDDDMNCQMKKVQEKITQALGNEGGAKAIIAYYEKNL